MKNYIFKSILFIFISIFSIAGPFYSYINTNNYSDFEFINLETGTSNHKGIANLKEEINYLDRFFLKIFFTLYKSPYQSGEYVVKNKSLIEIQNDFISGNILINELTIIPGMNIYEINNLINNTSLINDCINLKCLDNSFNFYEGTIFPDTYFYKKGMLVSELLQESSTNLENFIKNIYKNKPKNNPLSSIEDVLILASIIEKEAGTEDEKDLIASVFLKRLEIGMRLQADPTIIYGLLPNFDGDIKTSDIKNKDNIFNTYVINKLPPTPIAVVNKKSIEAAVLNIPGEYLYFVANNKGDHYFSKSYDEHLEAVKLYQLK